MVIFAAILGVVVGFILGAVFVAVSAYRTDMSSAADKKWTFKGATYDLIARPGPGQ